MASAGPERAERCLVWNVWLCPSRGGGRWCVDSAKSYEVRKRSFQARDDRSEQDVLANAGWSPQQPVRNLPAASGDASHTRDWTNLLKLP